MCFGNVGNDLSGALLGPIGYKANQFAQSRLTPGIDGTGNGNRGGMAAPNARAEAQVVGPNGQAPLGQGQQLAYQPNAAPGIYVPPTLGAAMAANPGAYQTQPGGKKAPAPSSGSGI